MKDITNKVKMDEDLENKYVYNFWTNVAEGALYCLGTGMIPLATVLTYFISAYVKSKTLIGFLGTINTFMLFLPNILISRYIQGMEQYKPYLIRINLLQRITWIIAGMCTFILPQRYPEIFIVAFYVLYAVFGLFSGFSSQLWYVFITKIVPERRLGRFLGMRASIIGSFEILGSIIGGLVLKSIGFPYNYACIFTIVGILGVLSIVFLKKTYEPVYSRHVHTPSIQEFKGKIRYILKYDRNFIIYLASTYMIALGKSAFSFQIIYAKDILNITPAQVSISATLLFISQTLGYLLWGYFNDRYGFKVSISISSFMFIPAVFMTLLSKNAYMVYISIIIFGMAQSARNAGENPLVISFCKPEDRALYIGLRNTILGPAFAFGSTVAGMMVDLWDYQFMFIVCALFGLIGAIIFTLLVKTRNY